MRLPRTLVLVVGVSACGTLEPEPPPTSADGGVTCASFASRAKAPGPDGGVQLTAPEGLGFPVSDDLCLEPGEQYEVTIDPHGVAVLDLDVERGALAITARRGAAALDTRRTSTGYRGWALAGKNPVTWVVSSNSTSSTVLSFSVTLAALSGSRIGPVALADGGVGSAEIEPTANPALAPLYAPARPGDLPQFELGLDRNVEDVLDDTTCGLTETIPERFVAVALDAGSYKLTGSVGGPSYRVVALHADGGVLAAGTLNPLATIDLVLTAPDRLAIGASRGDRIPTCGFDGGLPPSLLGTASFYLR